MHPKLVKLPAPQIVNKVWGHEVLLFNTKELCGKLLCFNKGASFSLHMHKDKYEFFRVNFGKLRVEGINTEDASRYYIDLEAGDILEVQRGAFHKITALEKSEITEFSTEHRDSDSYRIESSKIS
jgi:mannose-6-phosphate isomerase-like protein (cupin superfamily)